MLKQLLCKETSPRILNKSELNYIFVTEFNDKAVEEFYAQFLALSSNPEVKVIPVVVSSYGGQVHALLSMLDLIESSMKPVSTIGMGKAMSCGAVLLAAGTKGYRFAAPNTDIMLHEISSVEWGKAADIANGAKTTKRLNTKLFKILESKSTVKGNRGLIKKMRAKGNVDWFLTPGQYLKMGLIDHIGVPALIGA